MNTTMLNRRKCHQVEIINWKNWSVAALSLALLAGAIISTSSVAQLSYQSAQLHQREQALRAQKQLFQEEYASVTSLESTTAFASNNGFTAATIAQATLDVSMPLAQAQ
jgi:cell division protein FtsL